MLTKISVEGFKSLQDVQDLELGLVNVFIGANGSGKSNLLEAIGVLGAAISGRVDDQTLLRRGVRPGSPALYKTSLKEKRFRRTITLQASGEWEKESANYLVSLDNPIKAPEVAWKYNAERLWRGDDKDEKIVGRSLHGKSFVSRSVRLVPGARNPARFLQPDAGLVAIYRGYEELRGAPAKLIEHLDEYAIFSPTTPVLRGILPDTEQKDPLGLSGGRLPEALEDLLDLKESRLGRLDLEEILNLLDWVSEFDTAAPSPQLLSSSVPSLRHVIRFRDRWMHERRNQLSGYDASEGALYVLFMLTLALHPRTPGVFAVDNFDQAMHPRLARAAMRLFCQQILESDPPRQALLTTHNPLVLDGLDLRDDRIRLFAVGRSSKGATQVNRVQVSEDVLQATQAGLSLSNLWVLGRLGGVPDLF